MMIYGLSVDFSPMSSAPVLREQASLITQQIGYLRELASVEIRGSPEDPQAVAEIVKLAKSDRRTPGDFHRLIQICQDVLRLNIQGLYKDAIAISDLGINLSGHLITMYPETIDGRPLVWRRPWANFHRVFESRLEQYKCEAYVQDFSKVDVKHRVSDELLRLAIGAANVALDFWGLSQKDRANMHYARASAYCKLGDFKREAGDEWASHEAWKGAAQDAYLASALNVDAEDSRFQDAMKEITDVSRSGAKDPSKFSRLIIELSIPNMEGEVWKGDSRPIDRFCNVTLDSYPDDGYGSGISYDYAEDKAARELALDRERPNFGDPQIAEELEEFC